MVKILKKKTLCSILSGMVIGGAVGIGARLLCMKSGKRRLIKRAERRAERILLQLMR